ncbi:MAG: zf-HC2 domain-containing protein [Candidatus Poribacteria bacterium]|nr:zf-HC2 domain-containing protein [Candidatus Poribacteria bacterium]
MKHERIQKQLSAYLDNELAPAMHKQVDDHLRDCQECANMLADFKQNRQQISQLVHPAPSMKNAVLAMIRETESAPQNKLLSIFRRWIFRPFTVGATAFSTVCFVVAFFIFTYSPAPQYEELLDFYFGVHTEEVANNPLKSNIATPLSNPSTDTEDIDEDTETLLNLYLGE